MKTMEAPKLKVPPGACDCHMHVYEDRFTVIAQATFKPPHAPPEDYLAMRGVLGLERVVVIQPSGYGFDNTCTLEAMAAFGAGTRGIAIVPEDVPDAALDELFGAGIRGARFFMLPGGIVPWRALEPLAARMAARGGHINLQLDGRDLPQYEERLAKLPCDLVIDHNGKFLEPVATDHPGFATLLRLLDTGRCWVKLSAPYETSRVGPPKYGDVGALARAFARANPDRCLWASNWPHPNQKVIPSSAGLLDLLLEWADDDVARRKILADNPARLYGFEGS